MNERFQAREGLPANTFPPSVPVFTGHYHKPHTVSGSAITYIGSPYQGAEPSASFVIEDTLQEL